MISVSAKFAYLRERAQPALIPFLTAGDPSLELTAKALLTLDRCGADLIELGIPYADPLADGPVIQSASSRALARGVKLNHILELVQTVSPQLQAPIILFSYYNPILQKGINSFLDAIYTAGARGLIVPDLPVEEADLLLKTAQNIGIEVTMLVAPTSSLERMQKIAAATQGFIYLVSTTGVTGMRQAVGKQVKIMLENLRTVTDKPIGVGFGISQPEHAKQVIDWGADAAIVGSAMVKKLAESQDVQVLGEFCATLKRAINRD
ncbi:MAG: tryptophan synthase subunit alpha [Pseudanabaenaceae cyanobacterium]